MILVSAIDIYSGDTIEIPTGFEIVNCSVISSTYNTEGLDLNWSGENIIVSTSPYYQSDNLTIDCWVIKYGEVKEEHYHSGGGSSCSYNENYDWKCSDWTSCINGTQTRTCNTYNNCGSIYGMPDVTNNCSDKIILDNNDTIIDEPIVEDDLSWWDKFVNWLKRLFGRD